jgi:hypothetical protein
MATLTIPVERGGWWHEYVCPAHGVELVHIGLFDGVFPDGGVPCRYGCRVDTLAVRGAWLVLAHQACARRLRLLAHTGERADAVAGLVEYVDRYAELRGQHEQAADWMLRGRLFHQALTEAIWATTIGHTVWTLAAERTDDLAPVLPLLDALSAAASAGRDTLVHRGQFTSNYTAWLNAAGVITSRAAALVRGEPWDGEEHWLTGEHGVYAHLLAATGPDGWEWEASTYYHGFVLRAVLLTLRGTDPAALPAGFTARTRAMIGALAGIATDGGVLPAVHDGPYVRPALALEWLELVALAAQFAGDVLGPVVPTAREEAGDADDRLDTLLDGWFTGPPLTAPDVPRSFADAGLTVVRAGGVHALLDHGPHGGNHGHRDKLSLSLYGERTPWQPDPGQVPYGHGPLRRYYMSTAAHPAFGVDGLEQAESTGRLVDNTAVANDCYAGVVAARRLVAGDGYLLDVIRIKADAERDLTVHLRPDCTLSLRVTGDVVHSTWVGEETMHGWHVCTVPAFPLLRPGFGPADNPQRTRTHVDWTARAEDAVFCSVYQAGAPTVTGVRLVGTTLVVGETTHEIGDLPC